VAGSDDFLAFLRSDVGPKSIMLRFAFDQTKPVEKVVIPAVPDSAAVSDDGSMVALGYERGLIEIVDAHSGAVLARLTGSGGMPLSLRFSHHGRRLYTATGKKMTQDSVDNAFRIWDIKSASLLSTTFLYKDKEWLTVAPDGYFVASKDGAALLTERTGAVQSATVPQDTSLRRPDVIKARLAGVSPGAPAVSPPQQVSGLRK
jgi:hypothetical protein